MLLARGAAIIDADVAARDVVRPPSAVLDELVASFSPAILDRAGLLDRSKLASLVFRDPTKRERLNAIMHPAIRARMLGAAAELASAVTVMIVPLLFESPLRFKCRLIIGVVAPPDIRWQRVRLRDGMSWAEFDQRRRGQVDDAVVCSQSDILVANDSDLGALERSVGDLWSALRVYAAACVPGRRINDR